MLKRESPRKQAQLVLPASGLCNVPEPLECAPSLGAHLPAPNRYEQLGDNTRHGGNRREEAGKRGLNSLDVSFWT